MKIFTALIAVTLLSFIAAAQEDSGEEIYLASDPALSPDGKVLAFSWRGDIWSVSTMGGTARQLTRHTARDGQPCFSPDGARIAFISDRHGSSQVYVMPAEGGVPERLTHHTAGYSLIEWYPNEPSLLVSGTRDNFWQDSRRLFAISSRERGPERLLFDAAADDASLSPDGKRVLFTREGMVWWRKGYTGSAACQIWMCDLETREFTRLLDHTGGSRSPLWKPEGDGFYFVGAQSGSFNLWEYDLDTGNQRQLTRFDDDSVVEPCISRNGKAVVFRHLFHFFRFHPETGTDPERIDVRCGADSVKKRIERPVLTRAEQAAFSADGLDVAFIAGGDLWVMDTELREPKRITATPGWESEAVFLPAEKAAPEEKGGEEDADEEGAAEEGAAEEGAAEEGAAENDSEEKAAEGEGEDVDTDEEGSDETATGGKDAILFISEVDGQSDLWRAERGEPDKYWWQNDTFELTRLTDDAGIESRLTISPEGSKIAYVKGQGDLWVADRDGENAAKVIESCNAPAYDWSPDGKWLAYAVDDNDFNRDIWIIPSDASAEPCNVSRHPDNESDPAWSPDGKILAFTGRRSETEVDIHYVWLTRDEDEKTDRDRSLEKALEKMDKARKKKKGGGGPGAGKGGREKGDDGGTKPAAEPEPGGAKEPAAGGKPGAGGEPAGKKPGADDKEEKTPDVVIDFEKIHERVRRISIPDSREGGLFWSHDSKKLAFSATVKGKRGVYTVEFPDELTPKLLTERPGYGARWLKEGNQIVWLASGTPASLSASGKSTSYDFDARGTVDIEAKYRAGFVLAWRLMRDFFYDGRLNDRNWDLIRGKYEDRAARAPDLQVFGTVVSLMLGELNGSHLGFTAGRMSRFRRGPGRGSTSEPTEWRDETAHLGLRFDDEFPGPGLKVRDVLPGSPPDRKTTSIEAGEVVRTIDGTPVSRDIDLTTVLNGPSDRDILLEVEGADGETREVSVRPISIYRVRSMLREKWIEDCRRIAGELSSGTVGYLYVPGMNWSSFLDFEREIYAEGAGRDGLIIDVRNNGGGSTADHLLTVLCQPAHALTMQRGGGPGYPQDRRVYAAWTKPIVVLCNQNSFSNAEIFAHAVKTLGRGQVVGVPTAGGVISTGGNRIMDLGYLRMTFRGWFVLENGLDMELNGAVPHHILWPQPGEMPAGKDVQLEKAVEVLLEEIEAAPEPPEPVYREIK